MLDIAGRPICKIIPLQRMGYLQMMEVLQLADEVILQIQDFQPSACVP